jgi:signal transduction histidine kinase
MTSGFFHDLVNPLTAVSLNIEQLKQNESRDFSEIQINVDQAIKALDQLKHFVFTVNRHVKHKSTESEFSLNEEIQQAIEILGYKARKAQVDVLFLSTEEIKIWGDSLKFHQVVVNLLSNAIDACQKIELPHKEIRIHLKDGNNLIHFSIQDCGEGIAPEVLPKIFDSFFTTKSTGTGIGLSTTKEIVEKELGGKIFVQSEIGKGALFSIDFPWKKRGE